MNRSTILFINQSAGYLMIDIIEAYDGHFDTRALASGKINPRNRALGESVRVEKIIEYRRDNPLIRIWTWLVAFAQLLWLVKTKYRRAHLFLVTNPPLATLLPLFCNNTYSLLIYDIYPETLVEYDLFSKDHFIVRRWQQSHKRIFAGAERVFTLNRSMKRLLSQYYTKEDIQVVPVWTDNSFLRPIPKEENEYRISLGLDHYFVVAYSGNLGKSHELSVLIDLAELMKNEGVFILITGGGDQYLSLKRRIEMSGLMNIKIMPWQPTDKLPHTLGAGDLSVVSLGKEASSLSMPSKTYNLLSVGSPILAISEPDTELARFIEEFNVGKFYKPNELNGMRDFILALKNDPLLLNALGNNALIASALFSPQNAKRFVH